MYFWQIPSSNLFRSYSNSQQPPTPTTPVVYDSTNTVVAPQVTLHYEIFRSNSLIHDSNDSNISHFF